MSVTYFVALPFVRSDDGAVPGQAQEAPNEPAAVRLAEILARNTEHGIPSPAAAWYGSGYSRIDLRRVAR
jgi:hypothetical protein